MSQNGHRRRVEVHFEDWVGYGPNLGEAVAELAEAIANARDAKAYELLMGDLDSLSRILSALTEVAEQLVRQPAPEPNE